MADGRGVYARELFAEAALEAFQRVEKLDPGEDIKAAFIGEMSESYEHQSHSAPMAASWAGLLPAPAIRVENACAPSEWTKFNGSEHADQSSRDLERKGGTCDRNR